MARTNLRRVIATGLAWMAFIAFSTAGLVNAQAPIVSSMDGSDSAPPKSPADDSSDSERVYLSGCTATSRRYQSKLALLGVPLGDVCSVSQRNLDATVYPPNNPVSLKAAGDAPVCNWDDVGGGRLRGEWFELAQPNFEDVLILSELCNLRLLDRIEQDSVEKVFELSQDSEKPTSATLLITVETLRSTAANYPKSFVTRIDRSFCGVSSDNNFQPGNPLRVALESKYGKPDKVVTVATLRKRIKEALANPPKSTERSRSALKNELAEAYDQWVAELNIIGGEFELDSLEKYDGSMVVELGWSTSDSVLLAKAALLAYKDCGRLPAFSMTVGFKEKSPFEDYVLPALEASKGELSTGGVPAI